MSDDSISIEIMPDYVPSVAVLGAGGWGRNHVRTWHELGALALVCDPDLGRLDEVRSTYEGVAVATDPAEAFAREDIDAVVLATPAPTHAELALAAMAANKDVFVEKPLAMDLDSGVRVVAAAEERGAVLMVGHVYEYHPGVRRLRALLASGELGALRWVYSSRLNFGRVRRVENALWSLAPHDIALLTGLAGSDPDSVTCRGGTYISAGVEDVAFLGMSFPGGVEAQVAVSWLYPLKERRVVVVGERAMAVFDDLAPLERRLVVYPYEIDQAPGAPPTEVAFPPVAVSLDDTPALTAECRHFLERIVDRARPLTDGHSGLQVLRILEAGSRSLALDGSTVRLADLAVTGMPG